MEIQVQPASQVQQVLKVHKEPLVPLVETEHQVPTGHQVTLELAEVVVPLATRDLKVLPGLMDNQVLTVSPDLGGQLVSLVNPELMVRMDNQGPKEPQVVLGRLASLELRGSPVQPGQLENQETPD